MSNHLSINGRLGQDPELRYSQSNSNAVATFTVADTPRRYNPDTQQWEDHGETLWLRCVTFGRQAEWFAENAHKGSLVTLTGTLVSKSWDDKETGQKRTAIECKVENLGIQHITTERKGAPKPADPWAGPAPLDEPPF